LTDENTLFHFCNTDSWQFLSEVPKLWLCLIHSSNKINQPQCDVERRQQNAAGFYQQYLRFVFAGASDSQEGQSHFLLCVVSAQLSHSHNNKPNFV
jgi:hypothetical protein